MELPAYQTVPVTCPNCGNRFVSPILTIIDAGQNAEAKALFLSGQINVAVCPQCGHGGMLSTPLVYHDPDKELLLTFTPPEVGMSEAEQQRFVGDLTNRLMSSLPAAQRKGYLLRPRSFLRLEGMVEAILEADGITHDMIEAQRARAELLDSLMHTSSEEARRTISQEHDGQIDYDFFQLLTVNIQLAREGERPELAKQLLDLRRQLLEWTTHGQEVQDREEAVKSLGSEITREALLSKLVAAALAGQDVKVETMVAVARPVIDYVFYQQLTARIEAEERAGKTEQAERLKALREYILDLTAEIDAEVQKATEEAARLLQKIVDSQDPEQSTRAHINQFDEIFLSVLAANLDAAERSGRLEEAGKLRQVSDTLLKLIQESQPPEIQFINELLNADYPDGSQRLVQENPEKVSARLLQLIELVIKNLAETGRQETAEKLELIREQVSARVQVTA